MEILEIHHEYGHYSKEDHQSQRKRQAIGIADAEISDIGGITGSVEALG
jgi:hypothetical protein